MKTFLLITLLFLPAAVFASEKPRAANAKPPIATLSPSIEDEEHLRFELLRSLLANSAMSLPKGKNCGFHTTDQKKNPTIADWVSWNLSYFKDGQANSISARCEWDERKKRRCQLNFAADSKGESPWSCGFRFNVDATTKKMDLRTLECIGTC